MIDYLIKKSDGSVIEEFPGGATKVTIPGTTNQVHVGGEPPKRPVDIGKKYFLAKVVEAEDEPVNPATQKRGPTTITVSGQTATVTRTAIAKTEEELAADIITARQIGYGSISDQLDMQYWDMVNGTTLWKDHIAAVKSNNPK